MLRRGILLFIFARTLLLASNGKAPNCPELVITGKALFPVALSAEVSPFYELAGRSLYPIGEGGAGVVMVSVAEGIRPESAHGYQIIKAYKFSTKEGDYENAVRKRNADLLILRSFADFAATEDLGFDFAPGKPIQVQTYSSVHHGQPSAPGILFQQSDRIGRTVESLVSDSSVPATVRNFVSTEYTRKIETLKTFLKKKGWAMDGATKKYYEAKGGVFSLPFLCMSVKLQERPGVTLMIEVMIKADGVIVSPKKLSFTVVDGA